MIVCVGMASALLQQSQPNSDTDYLVPRNCGASCSNNMISGWIFPAEHTFDLSRLELNMSNHHFSNVACRFFVVIEGVNSSDSNFPDNNALSVSDGINPADIPSLPDFILYNVTFPSPAHLIAGNPYNIVIFHGTCSGNDQTYYLVMKAQSGIPNNISVDSGMYHMYGETPDVIGQQTFISGDFNYQLQYNMYDNITCSPLWIQNNSGICNGILPSYIVSYYDSNNCGFGSPPIDNGTVVSCCVNNWVDTSANCNSGNNVTRVYIDQNNCGSGSPPVDNGSVFVCPAQGFVGGSVGSPVTVQEVPQVSGVAIAPASSFSFGALWDSIINFFKGIFG